MICVTWINNVTAFFLQMVSNKNKQSEKHRIYYQYCNSSEETWIIPENTTIWLTVEVLQRRVNDILGR